VHSPLPVPSRAVTLTPLSDGAVLHGDAASCYYGLSDVGVFVWERLADERLSFEALCDEVRRGFPLASGGEVRHDVGELLGDLARWGFVEQVMEREAQSRDRAPASDERRHAPVAG
jgi:hypothetical protein